MNELLRENNILARGKWQKQIITKHFWEQWSMIVDSRVIVIITNVGHSKSPVYTVNYNYDEPFK